MRVPRWNFLAVTRPHDAQRIYIRVRSEQADIKPSKRSFSNLLLVPYSELKAEAEEIVGEPSVALSTVSSNGYYSKRDQGLIEMRFWGEG